MSHHRCIKWFHRKYVTLFDRLFTRIFLSFTLCLLVIITVVLIIPNFDQRRIKEVPSSFIPKLIQICDSALIKFSNQNIDQMNNEHLTFLSQKAAQKKQDSKQGNDGRKLRSRWQNHDQIYFWFFDTYVYEEQLQYYKVRPDIASFILKTVASDTILQQKIDDRLMIGPITLSSAPNLKIYMSQPARAQYFLLIRLFDDPTILLIMMMICSVPFIALLSWSLTRPVKALRIAADNVALGNWNNLPMISGPMEYRAVGRSFHRMINIIKKDQLERNQLFANLSHELRTPLARIALTNALIRRKQPELGVEVLRIEHNLQALESRIQAMLSLSRAQVLEKEALKSISLSDILQPILDEMVFESSEKNILFSLPEIPDVFLNANLMLLQSAVENILRNALRFAKSKISISFMPMNGKVKIIICDDGVGIEEQEIESIFKPFYRNPNQENDHNGAGLGLAIAQLAIDIHKGTIVAQNQQTGGLLITITLPSISP